MKIKRIAAGINLSCSECCKDCYSVVKKYMQTQLIKTNEIFIFISCLLGPYILFQFRDFVYFRDYAIIFEGAYRLYLGETPYVDFGAPVGPISFLLPYILFKIAGPSWDLLLLTQQMLNTFTLLLFYILIIRIEVKPMARQISLILFSIFYLTLLTHPWYNSIGLTFVLAATVFAIGKSPVSIIIAGFCAGAAALTKQDFGLVSIAISIICILYPSTTPRLVASIKSQSLAESLKLKKENIINILLFGSSVAIFIFIHILITDWEHFTYWFNYGQLPHQTRELPPKIYLFFVVAACSSLFALKISNKRLLISTLFIFAATVTSATSGLKFTHYYFIGFLPILVQELYEAKVKAYIFSFVFVFSILLLLKPGRDVYYIVESLIKNQPEHYFFNYRNNSKPLVKYSGSSDVFSEKIFIPAQTIEAISKLKQIVQRVRAEHPDKLVNMLNISELTPLYPELGVITARGVPLWFHTNISFFSKDILSIKARILSSEFDIVLLQATHENFNEVYFQLYTLLNSSSSYALIETIYDSPANSTSKCKINCEGNIFIFIKNNLF
jgi:hypothetical protein